MRMYY